MSLNLTDDESTLVQVMAWCRQATSHYLKQCWYTFMSPYGITRGQWVKELISQKIYCCIAVACAKLCCSQLARYWTTGRQSFLPLDFSYEWKLGEIDYWSVCHRLKKIIFYQFSYHQISDISCTKSQNLYVSCLVLQLFLPNPLKPGVKLTMKM